MIKILLACSAGMSTSLMVNKMKKVATENGLEVEISAVPESQAQEYFEDLNILLLGPQVRHLEDKMRELSQNKFPVMTIDTQKYGMMDGLGVLKDAIRTMKAFKK
ncbi:PTS sugar transporter subunit IIB [Cetobacterium somerae]|uniref:PTS system, Lactose/Cellobiose specific IIB subunit n=1 Tax=Cetobacterium somerae ATCC BAA-474 TaxID=1319815 RepID=U7V6D6_9FUSO|nr:PTS sugar transporter subunit IIB [Cetobacterium somerae]ERT67257.1 PTS system, Lactose/Cellobiose specific IIB subunit [Cetobacterium somerae ATCC BAA-474]